MGALTRLIPALLLLTATPARADEVARWRSFVEEASIRFGVPTSWIERVIRAESRGHTTLNGRPIRSSAGAMGLMQLMPATWLEMRSRLSLGGDPDDPHDNILAGTYLAGRRRLPGETVAYLGSVGGAVETPAPASTSPPPPSLFVVRRETSGDPSPTEKGGAQPLLFAVRKVSP